MIWDDREQTRIDRTWTEALILWIDPEQWNAHRALAPVYTPLSVGTWLGVVRREGIRLVSLAEIDPGAQGPLAGGQVLGMDGPAGRYYFALPPAAYWVLEELVPAGHVPPAHGATQERR